MKVVYASIGENGKTTGGKPGDQTGLEVKLAPYYNFGQTHYIRFISRERAVKAANIARCLAVNDDIGYNQDKRHTLFDLAKLVDWDVTAISGLCDCDCSLLVSVIINCAYRKEKVPSWMNSNSYVNGYVSEKVPKGLTKPKKLTSKTKLKVGDIVCKNGHVVIITDV